MLVSQNVWSKYLFFQYLAKPVLQESIQPNSKYEIKTITGNILIYVTFVMGLLDIIVREITEKIILVILAPLDALLKEVEM